MFRKSQLASIPLSKNPYISSDSATRKIYLNQSQSTVDLEEDGDDDDDGTLEGSCSEDSDENSDEGSDDESDIELSTLMAHKSWRDNNSNAVISKDKSPKQRRYVWSFFKGIVNKWRRLTVSEPVTTYHPENGPYQPFAERAICLSNYGSLGKDIGQGISSHVYLLQDTSYRKPLVAKLFKTHKNKTSRSDYMKSILNEFSIGYTARHKNILRTYDFVKMDNDYNKFALIVDYCPEGDLYSLLFYRELKKGEIYSFFKQLLKGVKYLHDLGVAHRDLKPENLLIHNGTLKITDFGFSDVFRGGNETRTTLSHGLAGTAPYIAPEIFTTRRYWGTVSDVWSIGIVFYFMHVASVPFSSARKREANYSYFLRTHHKRAYPPFRHLPVKERKLLYTILNPDNKQRITVDELLADPWVESFPTKYEKKA
ncbi:unnamed protein product [Rhizopus stolonifer]